MQQGDGDAGHDQGDQRGVRGQPGPSQKRQDHQGGHPGQQGAAVDPLGMPEKIPGLGEGERPRRAGARQVGQLAEGDVGRHPGEKSDHHRVGHEPGEPSQLGHARRDHQRAGDQGQQEQRARSFVLGDVGQGGAGGESGGAGRGDDHQLAARSQSAADPAENAGVQPVDRVHARQDARGHAVGHAADRTGQSGDEIVA